jgi:hypothetical protein
MKNLLWLASYPKSGNTWMRIFLANLQKEDGQPVDINAIGDYWANRRDLLNLFSGLESTLLTDAETLQIRPRLYEFLNKTLKRVTLLKTHAPYRLNPNSEKLFPIQASRGVIYIIRNPLDLVGSLANQHAVSLEKAISIMSNPAYTLFASGDGDFGHQLVEPVSSWNENVVSWITDCDLPLLVVRYEDLVLRPFETFSRAASFTGLSEDPVKIQQAIEHSSFGKLQAQEKARGFREKPGDMESFFRRGEVGSWREELSTAQMEHVIQEHGEVMRQVGYLTEDGKSVF